jgi:hypothetical protein
MRSFQNLFQIYGINRHFQVSTAFIGRNFVSFIPLVNHGSDLIHKDEINQLYLDSPLLKYTYLSNIGVIVVVDILEDSELELMIFDIIVNDLQENLIVIYEKLANIDEKQY